jgi:hypothetical protein
MLSFDRTGRNHALTVFSGVGLGSTIVIFGRRFDVVWPGSESRA